jgi:hypothetical protein
MCPAVEIDLRLDRIWAAQAPYSAALKGALRPFDEGTNLRPLP